MKSFIQFEVTNAIIQTSGSYCCFYYFHIYIFFYIKLHRLLNLSIILWYIYLIISCHIIFSLVMFFFLCALFIVNLILRSVACLQSLKFSLFFPNNVEWLLYIFERDILLDEKYIMKNLWKKKIRKWKQFSIVE